MGKLQTVKRMIEIGGINFLLFTIEERLFGGNSATDYFHRIMKYASEDEYPKILRFLYKKTTGKELNLENPNTFNEKIQWLKLYDNNPLKTRLADKYLMREWVVEKIGGEYLVPILGVWDCFDDISFDELPNQFVLKANHGSGWNIIVRDKQTFDKENAKGLFNRWMKTNYAFEYGLELQYANIPSKIIAEKYLNKADELKDYRFYCFNGIPRQVWVDLYSGTPDHIRSIYDMDWNKQDFKCGWPDGGKVLSEKPDNFDLMKELARKLSDPFVFVRVDFYEYDNKVYIGELTFTPMSGFGTFDPIEWDYKLGEMLILPSLDSGEK